MKKKSRKILGIETSCDETSAAIIEDGIIKSNIIFSQAIHSNFGGVIPEIASREHIKKINIVVDLALKKANMSKNELNAIGVTYGPGLLGPLMVGVNFAKSLAYSLGIPIIAVNHIKAHIFSNFINSNLDTVKFPILSLLVSGGHTELHIITKSPKIEKSTHINLETDIFIETIGKTKDDSLGEAFDKVAKLLGLKYPGGHLIDNLAADGNPNAFSFPDTKMTNLDMSFSGIKTAFMYFIKEKLKKDSLFIEKNLKDICASIQNKLIEMVMIKLYSAIEKTKIDSIFVSGGVAANSLLRKELKKISVNENILISIPKFEYCTDNAGMITFCADHKFLANKFSNLDLIPNPRLRIL